MTHSAKKIARALGASKTRKVKVLPWATFGALRQEFATSIAKVKDASVLSGSISSASCQSVYEQIGQEIGRLVASKQRAYGDAFGKAGAVMRILYPDGISPEKMDDALTVVRIIDKLFRICTDRDALGEDPWRDVAGYGILSAVRRAGEKARREVKA